MITNFRDNLKINFIFTNLNKKLFKFIQQYKF